MRKQIINQNSQAASSGEQVWLDLQNMALVEISSEEAAHPIEAALTPGDGPGWGPAARWRAEPGWNHGARLPSLSGW